MLEIENRSRNCSGFFNGVKNTIMKIIINDVLTTQLRATSISFYFLLIIGLFFSNLVFFLNNINKCLVTTSLCGSVYNTMEDEGGKKKTLLNAICIVHTPFMVIMTRSIKPIIIFIIVVSSFLYFCFLLFISHVMWNLNVNIEARTKCSTLHVIYSNLFMQDVLTWLRYESFYCLCTFPGDR